MWRWLRRTGATLRRRPDPVPAPQAASRTVERSQILARSFIGRDGEMTALPLPEERDERFDPRPPLLPRDQEGRLRGW